MKKSTKVSAHQIAHYVLAGCARRNFSVPALKLCKLVYICQGYHLALDDTPLFYEPAEAWE